MSTHTTLSSFKKITPPLKPCTFRKFPLNYGPLSCSEHDYPMGLRNPPTISESSFIPLPSKIPRPTRIGGRPINKSFITHTQPWTSILSPVQNELNHFIVNKTPVCHENSIMNINKYPALDPSFKSENMKSRRPLQDLFINYDAEQIVLYAPIF
jgi:hypothetical protein